MFGRTCFVLFCVILLTAAPIAAQYSAARLQGTVKDASGAVIPGASIVVELIATSNIQRAESNGAGLYVFPTLQPGKYRVNIEAPGMEKWQGQMELLSGQESGFDPVLKVAGASSEITVAGDVTQLVTDSSPTLSSIVERERIEQLPLDGRQVQSLLVLTVPGLEDGSGGASRPTPFGLRAGIVQFQQDGASLNNDNTGMITNRPPGLDTVQQFNVEMSVASARYESPITAVLSTRSGTNQWHGGLLHTGRNDAFGLARAREDYYVKPPQMIRNEYGGSLGGPVQLPHIYNGKNRTFFFFAYEASNLRQSATMDDSVPTEAMRQGDFSQLTNGSGQAITLYDPLTTASASKNYARTPFPNNQISTIRMSPLAKYVYGVLPLPTMPAANPVQTSNWYGPNPTRTDTSTYTVRVDHRFGERDQIFGRYTIGNYSRARKYVAGANIPTLDRLWNFETGWNRVQTPMASWNHIFSPRFFVETMGIWSNDDSKFCQGCPADTQDNMAKLGLPNPFKILGAPQIDNSGFGFTFSAAGQRGNRTQKYTAEQNYTLVQGQHQLRFGWRAQNGMEDVLPDRPSGGTINFASNATSVYDPTTGTAYNALTRTGDNSANFFLGMAGVYSQTMAPGSLALRSRTAAGYFQDDWKLRHDLTFNLGMRYDYFPMWLDANGMNPVFDWANHAIVRKATIPEMIASGQTNQAEVNAFQAIGVKFETPEQAGWKGNLFNVGQLNFNPRVGLAYSRKLANRTIVVRGGFGVYRTQIPTRVYQQAGVPPLGGTVTYNINSATYTPDGLPNLGIRSVPTVIAGLNSSDVIDPNNVTPIGRGVSVNTVDRNLPTSLVRQWNVTAEGEILRNTRLRVAYIGNQGRNLDQIRQYNGQMGGYVWYATTHQPLPTGAYSSVTGRAYDSVTYGTLGVWGKQSYSNFHGMEVELQRRFSGGLAFQWYYVLGNAMKTGSRGESNNSTVPDPATFLPGTVPTDYNQMNRFWNYQRDTDVPKHRMRWNMVYELPLGKGKRFLPNAGGFLNRLAGGWQVSAYGSVQSRYWSLPTGNWDLRDIEIYGFKYPIQDCRGTGTNATVASCIPGYLYYNGHISANQINSKNKNDVPNGVMGVPSNYKSSNQPLYPVPAGGCPSGDAMCGTNNVMVTLNNGTSVRTAYGNNGAHPWRQQYVPGPWNTMAVNSSLFKVIPINERFRLRLNIDAFNVLNMPGMNNVASASGIIAMNTSNNSPRSLQWTARLSW
jgi:hypothetical protein